MAVLPEAITTNVMIDTPAHTVLKLDCGVALQLVHIALNHWQSNILSFIFTEINICFWNKLKNPWYLVYTQCTGPRKMSSMHYSSLSSFVSAHLSAHSNILSSALVRLTFCDCCCCETYHMSSWNGQLVGSFPASLFWYFLSPWGLGSQFTKWEKK